MVGGTVSGRTLLEGSEGILSSYFLVDLKAFLILCIIVIIEGITDGRAYLGIYVYFFCLFSLTTLVTRISSHFNQWFDIGHPSHNTTETH